MKKRYHTNHSRYQFSLNGSSSNRSLRGTLKGNSRSVSKKLANDGQEAEKLAGVAQVGIDPLAKWDKEEGFELKLVDEISENELKGFTFGCIQVLASLVGAEKGDVDSALVGLVGEKLVTFANLAQESREARREFRHYAVQSKKLYSSLQSLQDGEAQAQKVSEVTAQVMQCAERSMCQKYRSEALAKRVSYLEGAIAAYVAGAGMEMGFPEKLMSSVAVQVKRALVIVASK